MIVLPQVGQILYLQPAALSREKGKRTYKSRVADVTPDLLAIEVPIGEETGKPGTFSAGATWNVWYIGADGTRYEFRTSLAGTREDNIPVWLIEKPAKEHISRTQRRHFVRVSAGFDMAVKLNDNVRNYHFLARTLDVSGGGLAFACPERYMLREGDRLDIWLSLPVKAGTVMHARAAGEVMRIRKPDEGHDYAWVSVKFTEISESDRAKVIRACFERQLELRKKGILE